MPYPNWLYCLGFHNYQKSEGEQPTKTDSYEFLRCRNCGQTKHKILKPWKYFLGLWFLRSGGK